MISHTPPRLLTGIALLFWGGLTGSPVLGLIAAVLVEARSWTNLRWDFSKASYVRAWHFCVLCVALLSILAWLNGLKLGKIHTLFVWGPLTLLPLELAQRYGKASQIPLNTFSFFARKKMLHELKHGHHINPRMINTGYLYLAITLLATAVASRNDIQHFIGFSLILGACLFFNGKQNGMRPVAWVTAFLLIVMLSYAGHWGMFKLYQRYGSGGSADDGRHTSANESRTSIGRLGRIKLSPHIFWRMEVMEGTVPALLRTATYHHYTRASWKHIPPSPPRNQRDKDDYLGESRLKGVNAERKIRYFTEQTTGDEPDITGEPNVRIVGEVDSSVLANPIPLPHFTQGIGDLGGEDSQVSLECNSLGTVRINNPDYHVVSYSVWTGDHSTTEVDAPARYDLEVPTVEREAIRRTCKKLGLEKGMSAQKILLRLRHYFATEFTYTTHLTTPGLGKVQRWTAIGTFLEKTRAGHCEYFATATALILRECGIPARYCVGFAVSEYDEQRKEWVMRGKHSHAWCRVWDKDHWEDADLTPPSWQSMEEANASSWQLKLADWWQRVREDFLIWRTQDENKTQTAVVVGSIVGSLMLWLLWRLWKSRQRDGNRGRNVTYTRPEDVPLTALNKLEPAISRKLGPRPQGLPLCRWVMMLEQIDPSLSPLLEPLTKIHSEIRFDPEMRQKEDRLEIARLSAELKRRLKSLSSQGK